VSIEAKLADLQIQMDNLKQYLIYIEDTVEIRERLRDVFSEYSKTLATYIEQGGEYNGGDFSM